MERLAVQLRIPEELPPAKLRGLARATREIGVPLPVSALYRVNTISPRQLELMRREERRRFIRDRAEDQRRMREDWAAWGGGW